MASKPLKVFLLRADAKFMATSLEDAFLKLAAHFGALAEGDTDSRLIELGEIEIKPVEPRS